jgi:hypothetical protein
MTEETRAEHIAGVHACLERIAHCAKKYMSFLPKVMFTSLERIAQSSTPTHHE